MWVALSAALEPARHHGFGRPQVGHIVGRQERGAPQLKNAEWWHTIKADEAHREVSLAAGGALRSQGGAVPGKWVREVGSPDGGPTSFRGSS